MVNWRYWAWTWMTGGTISTLFRLEMLWIYETTKDIIGSFPDFKLKLLLINLSIDQFTYPGSCPILHLDENLSGVHLGQLTNAIVAQPVFTCHITNQQPSSRNSDHWMVSIYNAMLSVCYSIFWCPTGSFTVTLSNIKGNVSKTTTIFIPTSAKVHTTIQSVLDDEPAWAK